MPGWLRSDGSGPFTWMLSNATSTAWIDLNRAQRAPNALCARQHERKGRQAEDAAQIASVTKKEKRNENQTDQRVRRRPGEGAALLYRNGGLRKEGRLQPGAVSLADSGLARGPGRHRTPVSAQQQPGSQSLPAGHVTARPARGHVLQRRRAG